jgi:hypothetical protein
MDAGDFVSKYEMSKHKNVEKNGDEFISPLPTASHRSRLVPLQVLGDG